MRFELDEALGIFAQCCLALNYLHSKKILHRDLKSKNIFLDKKLGASSIPLVKVWLPTCSAFGRFLGDPSPLTFLLTFVHC